MDEIEKARRDRAKAKVAAARYASGSIVGSGPPPSYFAPPRPICVDWSNPESWPYFLPERPFLAEAVRVAAEGLGAAGVAHDADRAEAVRRLRTALARGEAVAFGRDAAGNDHRITTSFWTLPEAVESLDTCRLEGRWIMVEWMQSEPGPNAVAPIDSARRKRSTKADADVFRVWADGLYNQRGHGPTGKEAEEWADQHELPRSWVRDQLKEYPSDRRLKAGQKSAPKALK